MYYKSRQPGSVKTITADWKTIPWELANELYADAASLAEQTALAHYRQQVTEKFPEVSSSELANIQHPDRTQIRRKAGNKAIVEEFIPRYRLNDFGLAVISQLIAHIATLNLTYCVGGTQEPHSGLEISGLDFVKTHFKTEQMMGIYRFLMLDTRSSYLTKQYKGDARNYCALVPLIPSAFKRYHNIDYQRWKPSELQYVVNAELCKAMMYEPQEFSKEELLQFRDQGLLWKSGPNAGTHRNPLSTHALYGMKDTPFEQVPDLAQVMLAQIWCAHPENRTKYMVLTPNSWDKIPESIVAKTLFINPVYTTGSTANDPWLS